ncbi:MAG: hypothetical protein WCJ64_14540 [Rhodospirillaceae bacterium]
MEATAALAAPSPAEEYSWSKLWPLISGPVRSGRDAADTIHPSWFPPADYVPTDLGDKAIVAIARFAPDISPIQAAAALREAADKLDPASALERSAFWAGSRDIATLADALNETLSTLKALRDAADAVWDVIQDDAAQPGEALMVALEGALELAGDALMAAGLYIDPAAPSEAPIGATTEPDGRTAA